MGRDRQPPPRASNRSCVAHLRAGLPGIDLHSSHLPEQRTYPLLDLPKRRRPQRKRLLNRRCPRPRSSNHGYPLIQKPKERNCNARQRPIPPNADLVSFHQASQEAQKERLNAWKIGWAGGLLEGALARLPFRDIRFAYAPIGNKFQP